LQKQHSILYFEEKMKTKTNVYKGNAFEGWKGGNNYDRLAHAIGLTPAFYKKAIGNIRLPPNAKILDLACGTGNLSFSIKNSTHNHFQCYGIDISEDQLKCAREKNEKMEQNIHFSHQSIDELAFEDETFDLVITSMALHEVPPKVRHKAIKETSRILKRGGQFLLVDWSKPRWGWLALFWMPALLLHRKNSDNWYNHYPRLCKSENLFLTSDSYINSVTRRQVFVKKVPF
jgi:demethylmenaquinone methyltransferase/2-methoxy-6-polyprenyl-1,4-benzoquinol methylase